MKNNPNYDFELDFQPDPAQNPQNLTKRQLQAMETKDKIYNAAVKVINEKGFSSTSIEDITTEANVAKGSFYTHFTSKEDLVFYTYAHSDKIYLNVFKSLKNLDFMPMVTQFVSLCYKEFEKRGKGIMKALVSNYFVESSHVIYGKDRILVKCLEKIVEKGKSTGSLHAGIPTEWYANVLLTAIVGAEVMWCFDETGRTLSNTVEDAVRITARGLMQ